MSDPTPLTALDEARRERDRLAQHATDARGRLARIFVAAGGDTNGDGWEVYWTGAEGAVRAVVAERDAYKRAKAENDERFMLERDEARRERDRLAAALSKTDTTP